VGFALGSERVLIAAEKVQDGPLSTHDRELVFIAASGAELESFAFSLAEKLRTGAVAGLETGPDPRVEGPFVAKSLKSQLRLADRLGASTVIIFGEEEWKRKAVIVRDMKTQSQKEVTLVV